jgi:protein-S-isoprenylcysteine O-methyltransferase Ste14
MSLIPGFELGLWNAWLLILPFFVLIFGISYVVVDRQSPLFIWPEYTAREKRMTQMMSNLLLLVALYSIFLPLKTGTIWLGMGLVVYALGMIFFSGGLHGFSSTPPDRPNVTGIYRFSRNPMYVGFVLVPLGAGLAAASWPVILVALIVFGLHDRYSIPPEERMCLERYGDAYREYMDRTPRWIGWPRSTR